jgi:hypothetical protein
VLARRREGAPAAEIAETLRLEADHRPSPPVAGPSSGLTDVLVHGADKRIPLGIPHRPDPQRVARVIDFLTGPTQLGFFPRRRLRGIALHDEDTGQAWGDGKLIRGAGVAVMLAVCGRTVAFEDLTGPGGTRSAVTADMIGLDSIGVGGNGRQADDTRRISCCCELWFGGTTSSYGEWNDFRTDSRADDPPAIRGTPPSSEMR